MFRKTDTNPQFDLFTAPSNILPKRAQKKYTDEKAWHNQFFKLVTSQIDEESFRPLFEETKMGAPNASIRILVAMSILKEGFGCSDDDLFEKCEFDLLARKDLGLEMLDEKLPSLHVDESAQIGAVPDNNKSKTAYGSGISPHRRGPQPYMSPHRGHLRPDKGLSRIFNALGRNPCPFGIEAQIICFRADF